MNSSIGLTAALLLQSCVLYAQTGVEIRIDDETIPPGQVVQIKTFLTEPKPISGGKGSVRLPKALNSILGIAAFSTSGDLSGIAQTVQGNLQVHCVSPSGTWGTDPDYPLFVVAAEVDPRTPLESSIPLRWNQAASFWLNQGGTKYTETLIPGTLTAAGTLSVRNVDPGGGLLPAGTVVKITGSGFQPGTKLQVNEVSVASYRVVSSSEIDFTLGQATDLTSRRIRIDGNNGERIEYYSYLRAIDDPPSTNGLLASATPIFPTNSYTKAVYPIATGSGVLAGVALQNANATSATVMVQVFSSGGAMVGSGSLSLASRHSVSRELSEITGQTLPGAYFAVRANVPVQITGIKIDSTHGTVSATPAISAQ